MIDIPSGTEIFTMIMLIAGLAVTIILALTGYGWQSLHFLYGLPLGAWLFCTIMKAVLPE